jgi:hypothetical protein
MEMTIEEIVAVVPLATLQALAQGGMFDTKNGSVVVHFDQFGVIRKIERQYVSFKS